MFFGNGNTKIYIKKPISKGWCVNIFTKVLFAISAEEQFIINLYKSWQNMATEIFALDWSVLLSRQISVLGSSMLYSDVFKKKV